MRATKQFNPYSSGFTNVDIIGNEDLFPEEGYEFIPHPPTQSTKDRYVSVDFPLNSTINTTKLPTNNMPQPPEPVIDVPMPKMKSHRRKYIYDTTIAVRKKQMDYKTQLAEYNREMREYEKADEANIIKIAKEAVQKEEEKHKNDKANLRANYEEQIKDHKRQIKRAQQEEQMEVEKMREAEAAQRELDRQKEEKEAMVKQTYRDEFLKRNAMLQKMKATRHEREKEEEREIARQAESLSATREARAKREEEIRLEKTKRREIVVELQAKALAQQKKKIDDFQEKAISQATLNEERERQAREDKKKNDALQREREWKMLDKERQAKTAIKTKRPFPTRIPDFDEEAFAREQAHNEKVYYRTMQMKQARDRKRREKQEMENDIIEENQNLEMTTQQFNQSLKKLQDSVPAELGIKVPQYKPSMKVTGMV
ncbi:trichohyalin, putative [Trichomonas vaginalis G3]|uniref:Trichohyalin, putative n=1 Tax=Trichomonas vaginalis (strain ATCC PRA-98 / G3) TaxID=412133 RepID=A2EE07_TRIV3|nr:hypothetical protein TVAGG3_0890010 [Trichomonas vaginalis G3]EAY09119.1 trichohyalin, putative [Trichomonas vaginalis G3]KAI5502649.1 hypothetical protein TVAGG3_0890010 [Trichomonas vaginalis G3]|eukprot:XP_001321342.1 trichohyalin [Trichomonas vaginalis G3]